MCNAERVTECQGSFHRIPLWILFSPVVIILAAAMLIPAKKKK